MICEDGHYRCDFCDVSDRLGEFYTATGNHVSCQDKQTIKQLERDLQAAQDLAELRKQQIDEMNRSYEITMREGCTDDEMHCTCVPALRKRIEELENTVCEEY